MPTLALDALAALARAALARAGASDTMARTTARYLVAADARALSTHGVARVATYCEHLRAGRANGAAVPVIVSGRGAVCLIDAGCGLGFPACELAVEQAMLRARAHGVAAAGVTNSHHYGAAGPWLETLAAAGLVGLAFSNAPAAILPWGGRKALFGTNPIACAFPRANGEPLVIDLSLTQVTRGRIREMVRAGEPLPTGWGRDRDGNPSTDADAILLGGSLDAVGGMKGAMLAMMVELLCCALTGAAFSHEAGAMEDLAAPPPRLGQLFVALDPAALAGDATFAERVETLVEAMLADPEVRLPGARRAGARRSAEAKGVVIGDTLLSELRTLAAWPG